MSTTSSAGQERRGQERRREADGLVKEGEQAHIVHDLLLSRAREAREQAEAMLAELPLWQNEEAKGPAWDLLDKADSREAEAGRNLARAETAYFRALGLVPDYLSARSGLSRLYYRQLELAEEAGDRGRVLKYQELARTYDTGDLAHLLADVGMVSIECDTPGLPILIERYEDRRCRLVVVEAPQKVGVTPPEKHFGVPAGSYVITFRAPHINVRFPVVVSRAKIQKLRVHVPAKEEIPEGMIYIPGGPFLARETPSLRVRRERVGDFAISRFPVSLREYCEFLDSLTESERDRRLPRVILAEGGALSLVQRASAGAWRLDPAAIEGPGRERVPPEKELDVPVFGISWFDALAYAAWVSRTTGLPYRLPTAMEWEKAARGADGRLFPMGPVLDPSFAKRRESRPEQHQPEPIGAFPIDESPYGVRDLAGGFADFTSTSADENPLPSLAEDGTPGIGAHVVMYCGGSWGSTVAMPNLAFAVSVNQRTLNVGVRLALTVEGTGSEMIMGTYSVANRGGMPF